MTTRINIIGSAAQTSFSTVPTVQTQLSTDNSTKLASLGFVSSVLTNTTYLDKTSNQSLGVGLIVTNQCTVADIDTPVGGGTLSIGEATDTALSLPVITLKNILQYITYWAVGTPYVTTSTGTAVVCQKLQTGQVSVTGAAVPIVFSPSFTSKPAILLGVQGTTATLVAAGEKWITNASNAGFTANYSLTQSNVVLNWIAIGT